MQFHQSFLASPLVATIAAPPDLCQIWLGVRGKAPQLQPTCYAHLPRWSLMLPLPILVLAVGISPQQHAM